VEKRAKCLGLATERSCVIYGLAKFGPCAAVPNLESSCLILDSRADFATAKFGPI
jgi:hypothetical protein